MTGYMVRTGFAPNRVTQPFRNELFTYPKRRPVRFAGLFI